MSDCRPRRQATGRRHGVQQPIQMTVATTDGQRVWAFRYSSEGQSRSLFYSTDVSTLRHQHPDNPVLHRLSDESRVVVSEPLGDLAGAWNEVPESSYGVIQHGIRRGRRLECCPLGLEILFRQCDVAHGLSDRDLAGRDVDREVDHAPFALDLDRVGARPKVSEAMRAEGMKAAA